MASRGIELASVRMFVCASGSDRGREKRVIERLGDTVGAKIEQEKHEETGSMDCNRETTGQNLKYKYKGLK